MVVSKGYSLGVSHRDCVRSKVYSDGASHRDSVVSKFTGVYRDSYTERLVSSPSDEDDDRKIFRAIQNSTAASLGLESAGFLSFSKTYLRDSSTFPKRF